MTSITLDADVKREHEKLKPESLTWTEYLHIVAHSIDPERFQGLVEEIHKEQTEDAIERARERYEKARANPRRLLTSDEARRRVRGDDPS